MKPKEEGPAPRDRREPGTVQSQPNFNDSSLTRQQLTQYVACVFELGDIVEVRRLPSGRSSWQRATELSGLADALLSDNRRGDNICVGINPRNSAGGRKAEDVKCCRVLLADFDGMTPEKALARWRSKTLPEPTLVVASGHGAHIYLRLAQPIDVETWHRWQQDLAGLVGSDPKIHDPPRVMRVPGFDNLKYPTQPVPCRIIGADPARRIELADLHHLIPPRIAKSAPQAAAESELPVPVVASSELREPSAITKTYIEHGAMNGNRNRALFKAACDLHGCGWSIREARTALIQRATTDELDMSEIDITIRSAYSRNRRPAGTETAPSPVIQCLIDVTPRPLEWLWFGRFPLGKLCVLAGDPSLGKSLITIEMTARVSRGTPWPDAAATPILIGSALMLSAEDDPEDTIVPRLMAAGADLSRVHLLSMVRRADGRLASFSLADIDTLETALTSLKEVRLIVVDPVSAFMGGTDSHKNADVRGLLAPLALLAQKHHVAVVAVTHLNKSYGGKAMYRATGSLAFIAAARAGWLVTADPDDTEGKRRLMLSVKSNLGPSVPGLAYRVSTSDVQGLGLQPVIAWDPKPVTKSADDVLSSEARVKGEGKARDAAAKWLAELLANGPVKSTDVKAAAREAGFSMATIRRAKEDSDIRVRHLGFGRNSEWEWLLPSPIDAQSSKDAQSTRLSIYVEDEHLCGEERIDGASGEALDKE